MHESWYTWEVSARPRPPFVSLPRLPDMPIHATAELRSRLITAKNLDFRLAPDDDPLPIFLFYGSGS